MFSRLNKRRNVATTRCWHGHGSWLILAIASTTCNNTLVRKWIKPCLRDSALCANSFGIMLTKKKASKMQIGIHVSEEVLSWRQLRCV